MSSEQLVEKILSIIGNEGTVDSMEVAARLSEDHQKVVGAVKSLQAFGDIITVEPKSVKGWELTAEGRSVVSAGSHEALVYYAVPDGGIPQATLMASAPNAKVGFSKAMSSGWIAIDKTHSPPLVVRNVSSIEDTTQASLKLLLDKHFDKVGDSVKQEFKKRKLLQETVSKSFILGEGKEFSLTVQKQETDLTPEMLASSSWKQKKFKPYNFNALGTPLESGHLHPLLKVKREFRNIFLEMGFEEMPTNNFVESSFWNFDALFQPQQHPARDAHDTFFVSSPKTSSNFPTEYVEKVKTVHSKGGYDSAGYGYDWKLEEAKKNLLRTHTTAVSAKMLYELVNPRDGNVTNPPGGFRPVKYFSIDRVFRNETLDATHLAEFQQVEGVIADYNLSLGDLIGILHTFFEKLGMKKLLFKPAYNPYTEPSMEIFMRHEGLDKWIEVGNSGIFRPEMLLPMGLPEKVNVIAWGLSLERPTMIKYGINNIRDLVGPKVDLQMVYNNPLCRIAQ